MSLADARQAAKELMSRYHNRQNVRVEVVPLMDHDVPYDWVVQVATIEYLREDGSVS